MQLINYVYIYIYIYISFRTTLARAARVDVPCSPWGADPSGGALPEGSSAAKLNPYISNIYIYI